MSKLAQSPCLHWGLSRQGCDSFQRSYQPCGVCSVNAWHVQMHGLIIHRMSWSTEQHAASCTRKHQDLMQYTPPIPCLLNTLLPVSSEHPKGKVVLLLRKLFHHCHLVTGTPSTVGGAQILPCFLVKLFQRRQQDTTKQAAPVTGTHCPTSAGLRLPVRGLKASGKTGYHHSTHGAAWGRPTGHGSP